MTYYDFVVNKTESGRMTIIRLELVELGTRNRFWVSPAYAFHSGHKMYENGRLPAQLQNSLDLFTWIRGLVSCNEGLPTMFVEAR